MVWQTRPDLIVETGTSYGKRALLREPFGPIGHGVVLSIAIDHSRLRERVARHARIEL